MAMFTIVMGWSGLGTAWSTAAPGYGEAMKWGSAGLFVLLLGLYLWWTSRHWDAVVREFHDPHTGCYFPVFGIALMLTAGTLTDGWLAEAWWMWIGGAVVLMLFGGTLYGRWLSTPGALEQMTPAWLMSVIGGVVAPVTYASGEGRLPQRF